MPKVIQMLHLLVDKWLLSQITRDEIDKQLLVSCGTEFQK